MGRATFGGEASPLLGVALVALVVMVLHALRAEAAEVKLDFEAHGITVTGATRRRLSPCDIASVRLEDEVVVVELTADETLEREVLRVPCSSREDAVDLEQRLERARMALGLGPFRTQAL